MFISYFDESGDDGYPIYSSELFVLTSIYFHYSVWKSNYESMQKFRQDLRTQWGFPVKQEFHTKEFLADKDPYHRIYTTAQRKDILFQYCKSVSTLDFKIISVAIDKTKIKRPEYEVLRRSLTYNVQRIENDLSQAQYDGRFMIITDEGRVKKMRETTRKIQRCNYIPSQFGTGPYRKEITRLIEDPLPKPSSESYFIQIADMISFLVSLFVRQNLCSPKQPWGKRVSGVLSLGDEVTLLDMLKGRFNLNASKSPYGIVYYPK